MATDQIKNTHQTAGTAKEGKYLTFALGNEEFGLEILQVREIIGLMQITSIPNVPTFMKGVINLRGKIIPVIDLRLKFTMPEVKYSSETCIIVINVREELVGIIVDKVCEVVDIPMNDIEPAPHLGSSVRVEFITGIGKIGEKVKILLDIEKVLTEELSMIQTLNKPAA